VADAHTRRWIDLDRARSRAVRSREEKRGVLVRTDVSPWRGRRPLDGAGQRLPHGIGWFVQTYNGEPVVWQFGVDNASSSLLLLLPAGV